MSFKMICWRHWRLVWAQMRSFRDPERLLDALLEVMRGSCSAGVWPGWMAGRSKAEGTRPVEGKPPVPEPTINLSNRLTARHQETRQRLLGYLGHHDKPLRIS